MKNLVNSIKSFFADETGATAVEYGLLVGLIAAVLVAAVGLLGTTLRAKFCLVLTNLGVTSTPTGTCS